MLVSARSAHSGDIPELARLYAELHDEMRALAPLWPAASGLVGPPSAAFASLVDDPAVEVCVGTIDGAVVGLAAAFAETLPASGEPLVSIRYIFTEYPARGVGVAAAMLDHLLQAMESKGHTLFDAHVLPGHRLAKNFFESSGFKARHIVMHRK